MGDILKHITELIEDNGRPYEQPRPINRLPNFFDALDCDDECGIVGHAESDPSKRKDDSDRTKKTNL